MIRVAVAEDDFLVRRAVVSVLEEAPDVEVVATCGSLLELEDAVDSAELDLVISDIRMPPSNTDEGIRFAAQSRATAPDLGVLILSQYDDPQYALKLLEDGAARRGYLLKERVGHGDELMDAVRAVANGGSSIDPQVVERLVSARARSSEAAVAQLTLREKEVLAQMATGNNNTAIATSLHLTERAVLKHINSIFAKLGLSDEPAAHKRVTAVLRYLAASET